MAQKKFIQELADQLGFIRKTDHIHGDFKGYWFTITPVPGSEHILTAIDYSGEGREAALRAYLDSIRKGYRFTYQLHAPSAVVIQMKSAMTTKGTVEKILKLLEALSSTFPSLGLESACYNCGREGKHEAYRVGNVTAEVCPSCITDLEALYTEEKETLKVSGSYATGAIGAVLGALLGSVVWLIISYLGFIASFAGFAIAYAASYGYRLFRGKVGKGMPVILILSVLFAIFAVNTVEIAYGLYVSEFGLTLGETLFIAPRAFFDTELFYVGEVWKGMGLGLFFGILGSYRIIRESMDEAAFRHYEIEKL
jgi:hypothetical protein